MQHSIKQLKKLIYLQVILILFLIFPVFNILAQEVYFSDDFENGLEKWEISGYDWDTTSNYSFKGDYCITDSPDTNYIPNANAIITISNNIDLSTSNSPILTFWHIYYIEENYSEDLIVEISTDNGITWSIIKKYTNVHCYNSWQKVKFDLSDYKNNSVKIRFRLISDSDSYVYDGWYVDNVKIKELDIGTSLSLPFTEDFESGLGKWEISGYDWDTTSATSRGGDYCLTDSPYGNYSSNTNISITMAGYIDLTSTDIPVLGFWHKYNIYWGIYVEISTDGGFNWSGLENWDGSQSTWTLRRIDLSNYKDQSQIKIRFRLTTSNSHERDGIYIDDLEIKDIANSNPIVDSFVADPTSGELPLSVSFTCDAHDPDGSISEYEWEFDGDGNSDRTTDADSTNYTYNTAGTYQAGCTVVDDQGAKTTSDGISIEVYELQKTKVAIPDTSADPDESINIPITVSDASHIAGAEIAVSYNSSILTALDAQTTDLTSDFSIEHSISDGKIAVALANSEEISSGSGSLAEINFEVQSTASPGDTCSLVLSSISLIDENTDTIPVTTENGLFTTGGFPAPTRIEIAPAADTIEIGDEINFSARGFDDEDNSITINPKWSVEGDIGEVNPSTGTNTVFTATSAGIGKVIARQESITDTARVIVGIIGDINIDNTVDVRDAIICLRIIADLPLPTEPSGHAEPSSYEQWAADLNLNGNIGVDDALLILYETVENLLQKRTIISGSGQAIAVLPEKPENSEQEFTLPIILQKRSDVCAASLELSYNPDALTVINIETSKQGSFIASNTKNPGLIKSSLINTRGVVNSKGEIIKVKFRASQNKEKDFGLYLKNVSLFDARAQNIEVSISNQFLKDKSILPQNYQLLQNHPNPFNSETTISFVLPKNDKIKLSIYNTNGELIKTLFDKKFNSGKWSVKWKGDDERGNEVSSGIYFYLLQSNNQKWSQTKKMLFVK